MPGRLPTEECLAWFERARGVAAAEALMVCIECREAASESRWAAWDAGVQRLAEASKVRESPDALSELLSVDDDKNMGTQ